MVPWWGPSAPRKVMISEPSLCWGGSAKDSGAQGGQLLWDAAPGTIEQRVASPTAQPWGWVSGWGLLAWKTLHPELASLLPQRRRGLSWPH